MAESSLSKASPAPGARVIGVAARRIAVSAARQPARARVASSIGAGPAGDFVVSTSCASTLVSARVASSSCLGSGTGPAPGALAAPAEGGALWSKRAAEQSRRACNASAFAAAVRARSRSGSALPEGSIGCASRATRTLSSKASASAARRT